MAGRISVAVAARTAGAGFAQAPGGAEVGSHPLREQLRERFACRAHPRHVLRGQAQQRKSGLAGIDDATAEVVGGCARHRDQRGVDQPARGGFGDRERLLALLEQAAYGAAEGGERFHGA